VEPCHRLLRDVKQPNSRRVRAQAFSFVCCHSYFEPYFGSMGTLLGLAPRGFLSPVSKTPGGTSRPGVVQPLSPHRCRSYSHIPWRLWIMPLLARSSECNHARHTRERAGTFVPALEL